MTERSVKHATIVLERRYDAAPARVFRAWADPGERAQWDLPGDGWVLHEHHQEFRVGGREASAFGPRGGPIYRSEGRFLDIVPDARIVSAGTMHAGETRCSTTLCTIEIGPDGRGTRLVLTDQSAFFDGLESPSDREAGWGHILDHLRAYLEGGGSRPAVAAGKAS